MTDKKSFEAFSQSDAAAWLKEKGYSPALLAAWTAEPDDRMTGEELLTVDDDFLMEINVPEAERAALLAALKSIRESDKKSAPAATGAAAASGAATAAAAKSNK